MPLVDGLRVATILPNSSPLRAPISEYVRGQEGEVSDYDETWDFDADAVGAYSLIIVDWRVPYAFDFIRSVKVPRRTSRTPVVGVYEAGVDPERFEPLTIVPELELRESLAGPELVDALERLLQRQRSRRRHFLQDMILRLGTTHDEIEKVYELFDSLMEELGYDETDQTTVSYSFREALGNAAEHGNSHEAGKMIRVLYMVDHEKMCVVVTDEGEGFDHEAYVEKTSQESALETTTGRNPEVRPGGLGFHMMRRAFDKVCYNDNGNTIYLMKFLPGVKDGED